MPALASPPHPAEVAAKQRALLLKFVRIVFAILVVTFTMLAILSASGNKDAANMSLWWVPALATLVLVALVIFVERLAAFKRVATLSAVLFGVLAGLLVTVAVSGLIDLLMQSWVPQSAANEWVKPVVDGVKIIIGVCLSYLGVVTVLQTQDDFRLVIPYVEFSKQLRGVRPVLIDSSALIDGRVVDVASTNFVQFPLIVPRSVIQELQLLADQHDTAKRNKGRRGLDCIGKLQRLGTVDVTIDETSVPGKGVDSALVELAKQLHAGVMTTDSALQRVASINGVPVLNLHDLALATKQALGPGEETSLRLVRGGEQPDQAVGYLPDGTMVVVDDANKLIGTTQNVVVTGSLQTSAGRLLFAKLADDPFISGSSDASSASARSANERSALPQDEQTFAHEQVEQGSEADETPHTEDDTPAKAPGDAAHRGPFPPKPPRSFRAGTPRNPRR
jgi:uncharacterized protein YacL